MGNTFVHPTGPNVVGVNEVRNCNGNCGKSRFDIDGVMNDIRLISQIPPEDIQKKFEYVNEEFGKRAAPWYIWLFMIPLMVAGIITITSIRGSQVWCTGSTKVCSVDVESPDLSTCNKFWCCPDGFDENSNDWSSKDFIEARCVVLFGNNTLGKGKPTVASLCEEKVRLDRCNCKEKAWKKKPVCGKVKIEGKYGNFGESNGNFVQVMVLGQILLQLSWIIPLCFFMYRASLQKRFLQESFEDWKVTYGIEIKYFMPQKHYAGMLYLILPQSFQTAPQHLIAVPVIINAQVIPSKQ